MKKVFKGIVLLSCVALLGCGGKENEPATEAAPVNVTVESTEKAEEKSVYEEMKEFQNWYVGIWNNFVDFDSYIASGKDCTGSDIDIEFAYERFKPEWELKEEYSDYVSSLSDDYSNLKDCWLRMDEQMNLIYEKIESNGIEEGGERLGLSLLDQYSEAFYEEIRGLKE